MFLIIFVCLLYPYKGIAYRVQRAQGYRAVPIEGNAYLLRDGLTSPHIPWTKVYKANARRGEVLAEVAHLGLDGHRGRRCGRVKKI